MTEISTIYRGYKITYNENTERWNCYGLANSHAGGSPSLVKIRAQIDKMISSMRKAAAVEAFSINTSEASNPSKTRCLVVEYLGEGRNGYTSSAPMNGKVAAVALWGRTGDGRPTRMEVFMPSLMPNTKEALEAWEDAASAHRAVLTAQKVYRERLDAIPRLSLDDIKALVEIHEKQQDQPED